MGRTEPGESTLQMPIRHEPILESSGSEGVEPSQDAVVVDEQFVHARPPVEFVAVWAGNDVELVGDSGPIELA